MHLFYRVVIVFLYFFFGIPFFLLEKFGLVLTVYLILTSLPFQVRQVELALCAKFECFVLSFLCFLAQTFFPLHMPLDFALLVSATDRNM